jgi:hypothetical protein
MKVQELALIIDGDNIVIPISMKEEYFYNKKDEQSIKLYGDKEVDKIWPTNDGYILIELKKEKN